MTAVGRCPGSRTGSCTCRSPRDYSVTFNTRDFAGAERSHVRSVLRSNNRVEQAHQPTRIRERVMRRFESSASAPRFLDAFSRVNTPFRPARHRLAAAAYRAVTRARVATWRETAGLRAA